MGATGGTPSMGGGKDVQQTSKWNVQQQQAATQGKDVQTVAHAPPKDVLRDSKPPPLAVPSVPVLHGAVPQSQGLLNLASPFLPPKDAARTSAHEVAAPQGARGGGGVDEQVLEQVLERVFDRKLQELKQEVVDAVRESVSNLHVELIRQFEVQKSQIEALLIHKQQQHEHLLQLLQLYAPNTHANT